MLKKLLKDVSLYGLVGGAAQSLSLVLVPVYTRFFTPDEYGVIDLISMGAALFTALGMLQMEASTGRYFRETGADGRRVYISTAFWTIALWTALLAAPLLASAPELSRAFFGSGRYGPAVAVAVAVVWVGNLYNYLASLLRFARRPLFYGVIHIAYMVCSLGASVGLVVYTGLGVLGVFYGQLCGLGAGLALAAGFARRERWLAWAWERRALGALCRYSLPLLPGVFGNWANQAASRAMMLSLLSLGDIGLYAVALRFASVFALLEQAIKMAWSPFVFEIVEREGHREALRAVLRYTAPAVFLLVALAALVADGLFSLLVAEPYRGAAPAATVLFAAFALRLHQQLVVVGPGITKRTEYNSLFNLGAVAVNVLSLWLLVPRLGLIGAPVSLLLAHAFSLAVGWAVSERLFYIGYSKTAFLVPLALALALVVALVAFDLGPLPRVGGAVLFCGTTWLLFTYAEGRDPAREEGRDGCN